MGHLISVLFESMLLLLAGYLVPAGLAYHYSSVRLSWAPVGRFALLLLVVIIFALGVAFNALRRPDLSRGSSLRPLVIFLTWNGRTAARVATVLAMAAFLAYLALPYDFATTSVGYRVGEGLPLYVSVAALLLGLQFLYYTDQPISDYGLLIDTLIDDIQNLHRDRGRLTIMFPALNLGYARQLVTKLGSLKGDEGEEDHLTHRDLGGRYQRLVAALQNAPDGSCFVCYTSTYTRMMYEAYCRSLTSDEVLADRLARHCAAAAATLVEKLRAEGRLTVVEVDPWNLPQEVFATGSTSYLVFSNHLPRFHVKAGRDFSEGRFVVDSGLPRGASGLAGILAFRRPDAILAGIIHRRADVIVLAEEKGNEEEQ